MMQYLLSKLNLFGLIDIPELLVAGIPDGIEQSSGQTIDREDTFALVAEVYHDEHCVQLHSDKLLTFEPNRLCVCLSQILNERFAFALFLHLKKGETARHGQVLPISPRAVHLHHEILVLAAYKLLTQADYTPAVQVGIVAISYSHGQVAGLRIEDIFQSWLFVDGLPIFGFYFCEICLAVGEYYDSSG